MSSTSDPSRMDPYSDDPGAAPGSTAVLDRQLQEQEQGAPTTATTIGTPITSARTRSPRPPSAAPR